MTQNPPSQSHRRHIWGFERRDESLRYDNFQGIDGLVVGVDEKGPAKPAGIEPGDVIVKFDGNEIKQMRDLPRAVAETPAGRQVIVLIIRKGKEEIKTVTIGRLDN
jgi:S1-C subfamily serine protease